ncbi:LysE family translocator [Roseicyclus sp.]|uniref:LysE family translocator n=1 Tax=Roseicyclus sp. TaxID=1914329 RepID=UPI003F9FFD78
MESLLPFLPGFAAAYGILLVACLSPGPAVAMLMGISMGQGRAAALMATLGIALGSATINMATLLGVGLLLSEAAWAMTLLRVLGAAYLLWLAWGAFRKAVHPPAVAAMAVPHRSAVRLFLAGFLLQVTNPKAIAFWLAIAAVGATAGGGAGIVALFVAGAFAISFAVHGAWALILSAPPVRAAYGRSRRWIEGGLGLFFTFAAFRLATSRG